MSGFPKKLDVYIIRKYLVTFLFILLMWSLLASIIDLTEKVDTLVENEVPAMETLTSYYLNFIPFITVLVAPLLLFLGVVFFTSRMAARSEIIAIIGNGVSFYRLLVPYLVASVLMAATLVMVNHYVVPSANKKRLAFEYTYLKGHYNKVAKDINMQVGPQEFIYMQHYSVGDSLGYKFAYEVFDDEGKMTQKLRAERAIWKGEAQSWQLRNFYIRSFDGMEETFKKGTTMDTAMNFTPKDLATRTSVIEEMTTPQLKRFIKQQEERGDSKVPFYYVELYRRTADGITLIILTFIAVSMSSRKIRGGMGVNLVAGIALAFLFVVFMRFSTTFSTNAGLPPVIGVWLPNILFGLLSIFLLRLAPK